MKGLAYVIVVTGLLAACNSQQDQAGNSAASGDQPRAQEKARSAVGTRGALQTPLFAGYLPAFEYELRADKTSTNKNGQRVRRVVLEFIGMDQANLIAKLDHELAEQGYAGKTWKQDARGMRTQYIRKDSPRVGITITPASAEVPARSPDAQGFVTFVWIEGAN